MNLPPFFFKQFLLFKVFHKMEIFFSCGIIFKFHGNIERAIKYTIPPDEIKKTRTIISIFQQLAMMIGTACSGILISEFNEFFVFPIISILAIISAVIFLMTMRNVRVVAITEEEKAIPHILSIKNGILHIFENKSLLTLSICIAAVFTSAQVINVSLPAFIKIELGDGSDLFGLCEALWALGGILSAFVLTMIIRNSKLNWLPMASLTCLGILMIGFAQLSNPSLILVSCLTMGWLFGLCRTLSDVNILSICSHSMIGRVRSNIMSITSLIGIFIYLIPILVKKMMSSTLYMIVGFLIVITSLGLFSLYRKSDALG